MSVEQETAPSGQLARGLAWLAALGCRFPWTVLLIVAATCALAVVATIAHLTYQTSRNDLLSQNKDYLQRWQKYVAQFGDDEDMVVVVEGNDRTQMEVALERIAGLVRERPDHFDRLFYKADLGALKDRALLFLPAEQIRLIQDNVKNLRLLLEPPVLAQLDPLFGWKALTLQQLLGEAERRTQSLATAAENPQPDAFLGQLNAIARTATAFLADDKTYANPWQSVLPAGKDEQETLDQPRYFFSPSGKIALLMARPIFRETGSFTSEASCIDEMRGMLDKVRGEFPSLKIGLTGLPVLENDEMNASQDDSQLAGWLALVGVALLYLVVYRGLRYPLMTVVSLLVGTAWALGWTTVTVGHLNILSSAFAVMLIGMGDYGVLWVARFEQDRRAGLDVSQAMRQTALHVGPSIGAAAATTALAFFAAMLADLKAVAELGWIAGSGVMLCAFSCFIVMPPLLRLFGGKIRAEVNPNILSLEEERERTRTWLPWFVARPRWVLGVSAALIVFLGWQATRVYYDHNLLHLQAPGFESVKWEKRLIEEMPGATWNAVSYTTTREEALALKEKLEKLPCVSQVREVASLVPLDQERKLEQLRDIQERLRNLPERGTPIPHDVPNPAEVTRAIERLQGSLTALAKAHPNFDFAGLPVTLARLHAMLRNRPDAGERLRDFEQRVAGDLAEDLHRLRDVSKPEKIDVGDIPVCLRERYVGKDGKWLLQVFGKECLWEFGPLERFITQCQAVDREATGKPFTTYEGLKAMRNGFLWAGVYALIAMLIVLLLDFGDLKHLVLAFLPLVVGVIATLGFMGLCGVALNPANLIAFPLILGVGMDNGVHVVHDYRHRRRGERYMLGRATGRGIFVAALTTILGFAALMVAQHQGLYSLGLALTLGVTFCMFASLVCLPCLLSLRSERRAAQDASGKGRRVA
ncbi:MAG: MMPL family transporter [Gemmataceae bacterium]